MLARGQVVNFVKIETLREVVTKWDQYEYRPEKGWRWVQRIAFAVLNWIGAHHTPVVTTFRRTAQENDDLLKSLLGQEGQWINLVHDKPDSMRIYMGPDEHMDLLRLASHMEMQAFSFRGEIETRDRHHHYGTWHNIPITVVPWMKGAIIVPHS